MLKLYEEVRCADSNVGKAVGSYNDGEGPFDMTPGMISGDAWRHNPTIKLRLKTAISLGIPLNGSQPEPPIKPKPKFPNPFR